MKKPVVLIFLLVIAGITAQETPKVVFEDSLQLKLKSLDINVEIIGNFATTTYDMKFFNELDRTLEGELAFPLGEGQAVSNFAMDVNGKLREAVVVEKELARVAFESTVRQNIDPGLLEKTEGNNYKARVYPILPNAGKHIVITYEQELFTSNAFQTYELPLGILETLDNFSITINVLDGSSLPKITRGVYKDFFFKKDEEGYSALLNRKNHAPDKAITVQIPNASDTDIVLTYSDYFYAYKKLTPKSRLKSKPKKITLLWDASYSLRNRNLKKELILLENYFNYLRDVEIQFISFNNRIVEHKTLAIKDGNWEALKKEIEAVNYDGGTSFETFNSLKITGDESLLFTDGLANLGNFEIFDNEPIYTISSIASANYESMAAIATKSGGSYINLVRLPQVEAVKKLKEEVFQFLGSKHEETAYEVFPKGINNVSEDFSISGKFSEETELELLFGYGGKVTERLNIKVKPSSQTELVKRLWAKQKLQHLNKDKEGKKAEILALAMDNHLITDYTSMLILDRIEDYVRYRIEPPQELRAEYKALLSNRDQEEADRQAALKNRKEGLFAGYEDLLAWYAKKFPKKPTPIKRDKKDSADYDIPPSPPSPPSPLSVADEIQEIVVEESEVMSSSENRSNLFGLLSGKVEGVEISGNAGVAETSTTALLSGLGTSNEEDTPLYIVDGNIPAVDSIPNLAPDDISNIEIIKGDKATALFGSRAVKGLIIITTKNGLLTKQAAIVALNKKIADKIELKSWNPDTPYIKILEKEATVALAYGKYLIIRNEYANSPSFYLDVSDFFDKKGSRALAVTVLTNLIEIDLNNHELMKALAYKLEYFEEYGLAVLVYQKVLELRPEEPQSYRDLALAFEKAGAVKKSYDLLHQIYNGDLLEKDMGRRFNGIEQIAFVELTRLANKYDSELKLSPSEKEKFRTIPMDVRVVIDWNHNDTDIDLWVLDPNMEKASYQNTLTGIGGRMSQDVTQGYGPEEFMLKTAVDGEYKIVVNYFADNVQKISGPTFLKVTLFTNFAKENEVSKTIIVRLDTKKGEIEVGSLRF